jgi:hypothetical protein
MTDRAAPARDGGARLQQDAEEDFDEDLPPDDGLDRLLGDQDLLMRLQLSGYAQREWMPVAQEFARYGLGVLTPWIGTGRIFAKVRGRTGFRLPPPPDGTLDDDAANELASDTVVASLGSFLENVLKKNRWDPAGGASLKTFFIGKCLWEFPNVYRQWRRRVAKWSAVLLDGDPTKAERAAGLAPAPEVALLRASDAREALAAVSKETARKAFVLQEMGYSLDEIARELGLGDAKAVENLLGYQRRRLQARREREAR